MSLILSLRMASGTGRQRKSGPEGGAEQKINLARLRNNNQVKWNKIKKKQTNLNRTKQPNGKRAKEKV